MSGITKTQLKEHIKQHFGYPYVKVELSDDQLNGFILRARNMHLKWAAGNQTFECFFTKIIEADTINYELPAGVTEIIDMNDSSNNLGTANQLFTVQNQMVMTGMLQSLNSSSFSLIDYHLGLNYLDELNRYTVSSYAWRYHNYNNTLTLSPMPSATDNWDSSTTNYMLLRAFMQEGYEVGDETVDGEYIESLYNDPWFQEYCIALSKITLGYTRRKFGGPSPIGNTGIELDGADLISEGNEEKQRLEEELRDNEVYEGFGIDFG